MLLFSLWIIINKDSSYFKFVKKYWFYKKSKNKKLATKLYLISIIVIFISLLDFRIDGSKLEDITNRSNKTIILIDNSLSMRASDLKPSRIEKALEFASLYLSNNKYMIYSLIAFSDYSKVLVPFTPDKEIIRTKLGILSDVEIFRGGSNLFLSIKESIKYIKNNSINKRPTGNILVLTDGDVHDFKKNISIPKGIKIANINFSSKLGGAVPSFDLDGNYKEPLLFKGKRVHSVANIKLFKKLENDFVNFKHWVWEPGVSLEEDINIFFGKKEIPNEEKNDKKVVFLTLWIAGLGIVFMSLSFLISRLKSFNKSLIYIPIIIFLGFGYNFNLFASLKLEGFLYSKIKNGKSSRIERLKLAEIYFKKNKFEVSKKLYEENLFESFKNEEFANIFNYATLLLKMGKLKEGVNVFDRLKKIYRNDKEYKKLEKKINSNILIALYSSKKFVKRKNIIKSNQSLNNKKLRLMSKKKLVNDLDRSIKKESIFNDQLVNHILSQDREVQKTKMMLNIFKNKANWEYKGW